MNDVPQLGCCSVPQPERGCWLGAKGGMSVNDRKIRLDSDCYERSIENSSRRNVAVFIAKLF